MKSYNQLCIAIILLLYIFSTSAHAEDEPGNPSLVFQKIEILKARGLIGEHELENIVRANRRAIIYLAKRDRAHEYSFSDELGSINDVYKTIMAAIHTSQKSTDRTATKDFVQSLKNTGILSMVLQYKNNYENILEILMFFEDTDLLEAVVMETPVEAEAGEQLLIAKMLVNEIHLRPRLYRHMLRSLVKRFGQKAVITASYLPIDHLVGKRMIKFNAESFLTRKAQILFRTARQADARMDRQGLLINVENISLSLTELEAVKHETDPQAETVLRIKTPASAIFDVVATGSRHNVEETFNKYFGGRNLTVEEYYNLLHFIIEQEYYNTDNLAYLAELINRRADQDVLRFSGNKGTNIFDDLVSGAEKNPISKKMVVELLFGTTLIKELPVDKAELERLLNIVADEAEQAIDMRTGLGHRDHSNDLERVKKQTTERARTLNNLIGKALQEIDPTKPGRKAKVVDLMEYRIAASMDRCLGSKQ
jgi:hypothetical protein